jgi:peptidoglycan LD-endopeptidase CwlK
MPKLSKTSLTRLSSCDPRLRNVAAAAIEHTDFIVLCGHRNEKDQNEAFDKGNSKLRWPKSKHNKMPSLAMDLAPWPIDWQDLARFKKLMDIVKQEGDRLGVKLRFGWDWNGNGKPDDSFKDWPHVELVT